VDRSWRCKCHHCSHQFLSTAAHQGTGARSFLRFLGITRTVTAQEARLRTGLSAHRLQRYRDCYRPSHRARDHRRPCLHPGMRPFWGSSVGHWNGLPGGRAEGNLLCPCGVFSVGCWGDPRAGGTVSAAPSSSTAVRRHHHGDFLLRAMEDSFDLSADAILEDTEDLQTASAVAAHLQALRHWRKRARGSQMHRWPGYDGSVPGRRPNERRNFRSGLRAILRDFLVLMGSHLSTTRVTLIVGSACLAACFVV